VQSRRVRPTTAPAPATVNLPHLRQRQLPETLSYHPSPSSSYSAPTLVLAHRLSIRPTATGVSCHLAAPPTQPAAICRHCRLYLPLPPLPATGRPPPRTRAAAARGRRRGVRPHLSATSRGFCDFSSFINNLSDSISIPETKHKPCKDNSFPHVFP
jgi:hypothetical protein